MCLFGMKAFLATMNKNKTRNESKKATSLLVGLYIYHFFSSMDFHLQHVYSLSLFFYNRRKTLQNYSLAF